MKPTSASSNSSNSAPGEPLAFSLTACKSSAKPAYNSLAYEWGDTPPNRPILINGRPLLIRENLHSFLKVLEGNQDDISERNAHVQCMGDIYAPAREVLVWLGPSTPESDFIFDMCSDPEATSTAVTTDLGEEKPKIEALDCNKPEGEALDTVYQRSYFSRLWIIQELFLARDIVLFCGEKSTTWSIFRRLPRSVKREFVLGGFTAVDVVLGSTSAGRHARRILDELDKRGRDTEHAEIDFVGLVRKFGRAQCSDARDHVYGLLGLVGASGHREGRGLVVADYSESTPALFARLLGTMPRELLIRTAVELFGILKLHHADKGGVLAGIPDTVSSLSFEVGTTHIGHLRHGAPPRSPSRASRLLETRIPFVGRRKHVARPQACETCLDLAPDPAFELGESQRQQLAGKTFSEITVGYAQSNMASHGAGPLYDMVPSDSCVAEPGAREGDDVFLLRGTNAVLIRQQDEGSPRYVRGILCNTEDEESIQMAAEFA